MFSADNNSHKKDRVARRLKEFRLRRQLTLKDIGVMVGLSPSQVNRIETGKSRPSDRTLYRIELVCPELVDRKSQPRMGDAA
jgi:transcriptional regulator with XRE-family HTH domain